MSTSRRISIVATYGVIGALIGLVANVVYARLSYQYFYDTLELGYTGSGLLSILAAGFGQGLTIGLILGVASVLLKLDPINDLPLRRMILNSTLTMLGISIAGGIIAAAWVTISPSTYAQCFLMEEFGGYSRLYKAAFAFVGGSIWGWNAAALYHFRMLWMQRRRPRIASDTFQDQDSVWPPAPHQ